VLLSSLHALQDKPATCPGLVTIPCVGNTPGFRTASWRTGASRAMTANIGGGLETVGFSCLNAKSATSERSQLSRLLPKQ
jgi:hypothetical protein